MVHGFLGKLSSETEIKVYNFDIRSVSREIKFNSCFGLLHSGIKRQNIIVLTFSFSYLAFKKVQIIKLLEEWALGVPRTRTLLAEPELFHEL